jgi:hypothetical protein
VSPKPGKESSMPDTVRIVNACFQIITDLRSYAVRVIDATFGYMAERTAAESGVPAAEGRERMWTLFERGALRLVGPVTDDDRISVEPCDSNEWREQARKNRPLVEWRRQMAPSG